MWTLILGAFSHFLMVLNSSINILFYCIFNAQFRVEARKAAAELCEATPLRRIKRKKQNNAGIKNMVTKIPFF